MNISMTGTLCLEQPGVKCFAQGHNGDGSWLTSCRDQTETLRKPAPSLNLYITVSDCVSQGFVSLVVFYFRKLCWFTLGGRREVNIPQRNNLSAIAIVPLSEQPRSFETEVLNDYLMCFKTTFKFFCLTKVSSSSWEKFRESKSQLREENLVLTHTFHESFCLDQLFLAWCRQCNRCTDTVLTCAGTHIALTKGTSCKAVRVRGRKIYLCATTKWRLRHQLILK